MIETNIIGLQRACPQNVCPPRFVRQQTQPQRQPQRVQQQTQRVQQRAKPQVRNALLTYFLEPRRGPPPTTQKPPTTTIPDCSLDC